MIISYDWKGYNCSTESKRDGGGEYVHQDAGQQEERASATQQTWREYLAGRCGWSLAVGYLVLAASQIADLLLVNQTFDVTLKDKDNTYSLVGKAIMRSVKHTATVGNLAQGSFSLLGTGPLTVPVVSES